MLRIKLFALFSAFALLALVRPRKCLELLEAADVGAKAQADKDLIARQNALVQRAAPDDGRRDFVDYWRKRYQYSSSHAFLDEFGAFCTPEDDPVHMGWQSWQAGRAQMAQECTLPPAGWRCTRRAGHDGPCAAVVK